MRPPEFTGGNHARLRQHAQRGGRFNEAAGIHRRKPRRQPPPKRRPRCFNEAAGIHRRKLVGIHHHDGARGLALQ